MSSVCRYSFFPVADDHEVSFADGWNKIDQDLPFAPETLKVLIADNLKISLDNDNISRVVVSGAYTLPGSSAIMLTYQDCVDGSKYSAQLIPFGLANIILHTAPSEGECPTDTCVY